MKCAVQNLELNRRGLWYLPPAYVVRGKVIFILGNVCLFTIGGGGTLSQVWHWGYPIPGLMVGGGVPYPRSDGGGYPIPGLMVGWSTPSQVWWWGLGVPNPRSGYWGVPHLRSDGGGYPIPGLDGGGYPIPGLMVGGTPSQVWMVRVPRVSPSEVWFVGVPGEPPPWLDGVPPTMTGWGTPSMIGWGSPPPHQHSEHLLHGGRHASCVHAGGLSCCIYLLIQSLSASTVTGCIRNIIYYFPVTRWIQNVLLPWYR